MGQTVLTRLTNLGCRGPFHRTLSLPYSSMTFLTHRLSLVCSVGAAVLVDAEKMSKWKKNKTKHENKIPSHVINI